MSVEQVAESTRIRQTLVRAIEHDDYRLCGGDFYTRGHIRSLARTVGLDPNPLIAEFDQASGATPSAAAHGGLRVRGRAHRERRSGPNWSAAMAAVLVLVVVYGVAAAVTGGTRKQPRARPARPVPRSATRPRRRRRHVAHADPTRAPSRRRRAVGSPCRCGPPAGAGCRPPRPAARSCSRV